MNLQFTDQSQFASDARIRVLIVAAYPMARAGLAALLGGVSGVVVVGQVSGGETLTEEVNSTAPTVLLLDLPEDETEILVTLSQLLASQPTLSALVVGSEPDQETLIDLLSNGARGFLPRESTGDELVAAVQAVAAGLIVGHPNSFMPLLDQLAESPHTRPTLTDGEVLTPRELDVLQLLAAGLTNRAIAHQLTVSENTIKFHVGSILMKLGAASRAEAVATAARRGLLLL